VNETTPSTRQTAGLRGFVLPLLCLILACPTAIADQIPVPRPPAICAITVTAADPRSIVVLWKGGTTPFLVVRGDDEDFTAARNVQVLASDVAGREFRDHPPAGKRFWYQVADRNSPPLLFRIEPAVPHEGDLVSIHGIGLSSNCDQNHLIIGGTFDGAPLRNCSPRSVQFKVPLHVTSDETMIWTANGLGRFSGELDDCEGIPRGPVTWSDPK
jgi:hypothetical protein